MPNSDVGRLAVRKYSLTSFPNQILRAHRVHGVHYGRLNDLNVLN